MITVINSDITKNSYEYVVCGIKPQIKCIVKFDFKKKTHRFIHSSVM